MPNPVRVTLLAVVALAAAACSDSATGGGGGTPPGQLNVIRLPVTAPPLCQDSTGAWFLKNGEDKEIKLEFPVSGQLADCAAGPTDDFARLEVKKLSLLRRPNGTLIVDGDSVFISLKWVGNDSILFEFQPTGLLFDPSDPPELRIHYDQAGSDLNGDGEDDSEDDDIEQRLDIWRQERPGDPFFRVGTGHSESLKEVEAKLNGFSRFALAY
jgi:hypothetical protein